MEDGADPVRRYSSECRRRFSRAAAELLDGAARRGGIDLAANAALAREIERLTSRRSRLRRLKSFWGWTLAALAVVFCVWGGLLLNRYGDRVIPDDVLEDFTGFVFFALAVVLLGCIPGLAWCSRSLGEVEKPLAERTAEARRQLLPFFRLLDWNTLTGLVGRILPELRFDDYVPRERVLDLQRNFDLREESLAGESVRFAHSGTFHGYPFVLLETRRIEWGMETYQGTRTIHWTERERDSDGRVHSVDRTEVLTASVSKPAPFFPERKHLIFGHDAAGGLSFSRSPSRLSGAGDSLLGSLGRWRELRKLRRLERDLTDDLGYTMLRNQDFELLFHSTDRDDEVQFRLLFTPLAQQNMVKLLDDTKVGYGDDFTYRKARRTTWLASRHLDELQLSTDPEPLPDFDFARIRSSLQERYEDFFKAVYFTFAPLMAIPLYNQPRIAPPADAGGASPGRISAWEMESIAYYQGEDRYRHPLSATANLLQVEEMSYSGGQATARIAAHGFRGSEEVDYVDVLGGDGRYHEVRVPWIEYHEVTRTSLCRARPAPRDAASESGGFYRRGLVSFPPDQPPE